MRITPRIKLPLHQYEIFRRRRMDHHRRVDVGLARTQIQRDGKALKDFGDGTDRALPVRSFPAPLPGYDHGDTLRK